MTEYKPKTADIPPSSRPVEAIKRGSSSDEIAGLQKNIADLSGQVSKLTAAMQTITQLEEKVKQLEAIIKLMPDSTRTLKGRVDEISNVLEMLQDNKSDHTFLEGFKCSHCHSERLAAFYVKCTSCGKESWMGWWPDEEK
jgi:predicted nuclease with TOPRIM domain